MKHGLLFKGGTEFDLQVTRFRNGKERVFFDSFDCACDVALRKSIYSGKIPLLQVIYNLDSDEVGDLSDGFSEIARGNRKIIAPIKLKDLDTLVIEIPPDLSILRDFIGENTGLYPLINLEMNLESRSKRLGNYVNSIETNMRNHIHAEKVDGFARYIIFSEGTYSDKKTSMKYN